VNVEVTCSFPTVPAGAPQAAGALPVAVRCTCRLILVELAPILHDARSCVGLRRWRTLLRLNVNRWTKGTATPARIATDSRNLNHHLDEE